MKAIESVLICFKNGHIGVIWKRINFVWDVIEGRIQLTRTYKGLVQCGKDLRQVHYCNSFGIIDLPQVWPHT